MRKKVIALLSIFLFLVACQPQSNRVTTVESIEGGEESGGQSNNDIFGKWPNSSLPLTVTFSEDFSSSEIIRLKSVTTKWENSAGKDLVTFPDTTVINKDFSTSTSYLDGNIEVHQINTSALPETSLAVTVYNGFVVNQGTSSEYIRLVDADILFNFFDHTFSTNLIPGTFDLESVMIHEAGHLLGMGHTSSSASSVMVPNIQAGKAKRNLLTRDSNNIFNNYSDSASLSGGSSLSFSSTGKKRKPKEEVGEPVIGMIELSVDKTCKHFRNGKLIHQHKFN